MGNVAWTIVIPVLNEGQTLGRLLERIYRLPGISRCEVVVVDGGSTDHTRDAFIEAARVHPRLYLLDAPRGKGIGLRQAFARAQGRYIAFLDGDLQYSPSDLPKLMRAVEHGMDLVVSRRRVVWPDHSVRRLASRAFSHLGRSMLGLPASDPQSGMKAFRASLLPNLHLSARHWGLDVELIRQAQRAGARIAEVEIEFHPRTAGSTKTGLLSTSFDLLHTALRESSRKEGDSQAPPTWLHPSSSTQKIAAARLRPSSRRRGRRGHV